MKIAAAAGDHARLRRPYRRRGRRRLGTDRGSGAAAGAKPIHRARTWQRFPAATSYQSVINCRPGPGLAEVQPHHALRGRRGRRAERGGDRRFARPGAVADRGMDTAKAARQGRRRARGHDDLPAAPGRRCRLLRRSTCASTNNEILAWLNGGRSTVAGAVLAARWSFYNEQDTPARDADPAEAVLDRWPRDAAATMRPSMGEGLADFITALGPDRRVLIVGPAPELKHPIENCLQRAQLTGQPPQSCAVRRADVEQRHRQTWQVLARRGGEIPKRRA